MPELKNCTTFLSSSNNTFVWKMLWKISYNAKIGQPAAGVGLEQFSGPRILKLMDRLDCLWAFGVSW